MRRMESVEALIEDASNSPISEQALATKFREMLRNPRKMRGFSSAERQAMARIASGKGVAGALQGLGKIMSPTGLMGGRHVRGSNHWRRASWCRRYYGRYGSAGRR